MLAFSILLSSCLISLITLGLVGASDEDALLQLKQGFGNPSRLSSWNRTINGSPCGGAWTGVTCGINNQFVTRLVLRRFNFTEGTLSSAIGDLPNLEHIDLSSNGLIGRIPAEINKLPSLLHLDLSHNAFRGGLPEIWSNLTLLANLTLNDNQLTGSIPGGLIDARSLSRLRLESNQLSGIIPQGILDRDSPAPKLRYFAIQSNNFSGPIPVEIGRCVSLRSFYAASNQINGSLPVSIGRLSNLVNFRIEDNELSGQLPDSMDNLTALITFNVSNNNLSGPIPAGLSAKFTNSSFVGNPSLCGSSISTACPSVIQAGTPPSPPPPYTRQGTPGTSMDRRYYTDQNYRRSSRSSSRHGKIIGGIVGGVVGGALLLVCLIVFLIRKKLRSREKTRDSSQVQNWFSTDIQAYSRQGRYEVFHRGFGFSYEEIVWNAGYFDTAHVIGKGRFATVYRSDLPDGTAIAVKVFKSSCTSVPPSFEKEMAMLASIKHRNVLSIKGYYSNPVEMAILSDFLPTGSLYNLLHSPSNTTTTKEPPAQGSTALPDWSARYTIALGIAQAMAYLHRGCGYRILHRDLKSSNILLETDLTPRVSDHGLVQMVVGRAGNVVETEGCTAPEVLTSKKYTEKSDVYSYGVILMELVTGKKAVAYDKERPRSLASWVMELQEERLMREVMDAVALKTCPAPEYMDKTLDLACLCVNADPNNRPSMAEIVSVLEGFSSSASPLRRPGLRMEMPLLPLPPRE